MESEFFRVSGRVFVRVRAGRHYRWAGAWVQVLDRDRVRNDLIAEGPTRGDGTFDVEFTTSEFNLDPFERETWPEVWIVISRRTENGDLIPVESFGVPPGAWKDKKADVGGIAIDEWMISVETVEVVPSVVSRSTDRLDLSPTLVRALAEKVEDDVAELTGWADLTAEVSFEVSDDIASTVSRQTGLEFGLITRSLVNMVAGSFLWAFYDPIAKMVVVHPRCATLNSEGLKVLLGHELVHVGQYRECAGLLLRMQNGYEELKALSMDKPDAGLDDLIRTSDLQAIGTELEGQATWTQLRLAAKNPLASSPELDGSIARKLLVSLATRAGMDQKLQQYSDGNGAFEERARSAGTFPQLAPWLLSGAERE